MSTSSSFGVQHWTVTMMEHVRGADARVLLFVSKSAMLALRASRHDCLAIFDYAHRRHKGTQESPP